MVLNELWGEKMVIYHVKFSKEMLIRIHTHIHQRHIPCNFLTHIFPQVA